MTVSGSRRAARFSPAAAAVREDSIVWCRSSPGRSAPAARRRLTDRVVAEADAVVVAIAATSRQTRGRTSLAEGRAPARHNHRVSSRANHKRGEPAVHRGRHANRDSRARLGNSSGDHSRDRRDGPIPGCRPMAAPDHGPMDRVATRPAAAGGADGGADRDRMARRRTARHAMEARSLQPPETLGIRIHPE